jgi:hypothetical protein
MYDAFPDLPAIYDSVPAPAGSFFPLRAPAAPLASQRSRHDVVVAYPVAKIKRRRADD